MTSSGPATRPGAAGRARPYPDLPLTEQVRAGPDAHLDYVVAHRHTIPTANRGAGDPAVQAAIAEVRDLCFPALTGIVRR